MASVLSLRVSRPVFGSVTPKQVRDLPLIRSGSMSLRWVGVANFETGWVASRHQELDCYLWAMRRGSLGK